MSFLVDGLISHEKLLKTNSKGIEYRQMKSKMKQKNK